MRPDIRFGRLIPTSAEAQSAFPASLETVEQSIDYVQELPRAKLGLAHWNAAFLALWAAVDFPADPIRLAFADAALCKALATEGWLDKERLT
jgi:hypothetical protein